MGGNICSSRKDLVQSYYSYRSEQFQENYTISEIIGKGSYSKVKLAYQNDSHQKVAVKIIEKAQVLKNNLYQHIQREKNILQGLRENSTEISPFIVELLKCCQDYQHLYFVMEYLPNGNLREMLKNKKTISIQKIKFFTVCILLALDSLNCQGIIHGDLKPQNILIDQKGYFKVADFSSAQYYNCFNTEIKGTKGYIAPQVRDNNKIRLCDNTSDFYSLGTILWEMAYGTKYEHYLKKRQIENKQNDLTGDSSVESFDNFKTDAHFEDFLCLLLKQNPKERLNMHNVWSHSWLSLSSEQLELFSEKKVPLHPFHPIENFFHYNKIPMYEGSRLNKRTYSEDGDSLYSSVLLNQKRNQELFASFSSTSSMRVKRKRSTKSQP